MMRDDWRCDKMIVVECVLGLGRGEPIKTMERPIIGWGGLQAQPKEGDHLRELGCSRCNAGRGPERCSQTRAPALFSVVFCLFWKALKGPGKSGRGAPARQG